MTLWTHYRLAIGKKLENAFLISAGFFLVGVVAGSVVAPLFYKDIIDAIASRDWHGIWLFFWLLLVANLVQLICQRIFEYRTGTETTTAGTKIGAYALSLLSAHSYQFFINSFAGSLVNKSRKFASAFDQMINIVTTEFLFAAITIVGILVILCKTSLILTLTALGWFALFIAALGYYTKRRLPLERQRAEMESRVTGVLADILTNALNLKIFSSKRREERYFDSWLEKERVVRIHGWHFASKMYNVLAIIALLAQTTLIALSIYLWNEGSVSAGTIVLVMSYSTTLFSRLANLGSAIRKFFDAYTNAIEFTEILNKKVEITDVIAPEPSRIAEGEVIFKNVGFHYKEGRDIFKNFNLRVKAGEKVGVVGTSGAGKTTITKLILRFADITSGELLIDGQDIRKLTQDDLRTSIAYVPQDPVLFHRSLSENIAYGKPKATKKEIEEAARLAHAHDFITELSHGYSTLVGERGIKLSGGERQRVAIARAILKNAPILILDEATSSLDSVSEMHIREALDTLMKGRTSIVIAHRLSTIEKMDRIVVMEKGEIVEEGNHKELLSKKGIYYNFWQHQNQGFIE